MKSVDVSNKESKIHEALACFEKLPNSAQIRLPVVKALLGVSSSTVWRMCQAKTLTAYKLTLRTTTFNVGELRQLLANKVIVSASPFVSDGD